MARTRTEPFAKVPATIIRFLDWILYRATEKEPTPASRCRGATWKQKLTRALLQTTQGHRLPGRMQLRGSNRRSLPLGGMEETALKVLVMLTTEPSRTRRKGRARKTPPTRPSCSSSPGARGTPEAAMERPHRCPDCGKTFSLLLSLQMHQMNHQMKRKQYECSFCGTAFSCPSELLRHRMIHTGERPYRCSVCGKGFVRKQHLVPHLRLHTGERPYHCAECGKDFICKHHLQEHQRTHTGERPYACAQCGKRFRRKKSLKDHWRVHSAEEQQQGLAGSARVPEGTEVDVRVEH
nr:zinc finger protein 835-like [Zootoca vivipara]